MEILGPFFRDVTKTRFFGLTRECGLHFDVAGSVAA
jgi:hypothetical protein